ncbi:hypothetical protein GCM10012279_53890 [Micromonospora yangpuensis]|nr:hypothetical protein GCM10012279_53890 [Micromonospora yangpuensis]
MLVPPPVARSARRRSRTGAPERPGSDPLMVVGGPAVDRPWGAIRPVMVAGRIRPATVRIPGKPRGGWNAAGMRT